jgi:hypothetical protein
MLIIARSSVIKSDAISVEKDTISSPRCWNDTPKYLPLAAELEMDLFDLLGLATGGRGRTVGHVFGNIVGFVCKLLIVVRLMDTLLLFEKGAEVKNQGEQKDLYFLSVAECRSWKGPKIGLAYFEDGTC